MVVEVAAGDHVIFAEVRNGVINFKTAFLFTVYFLFRFPNKNIDLRDLFGGLKKASFLHRIKFPFLK